MVGQKIRAVSPEEVRTLAKIEMQQRGQFGRPRPQGEIYPGDCGMCSKGKDRVLGDRSSALGHCVVVKSIDLGGEHRRRCFSSLASLPCF